MKVLRWLVVAALLSAVFMAWLHPRMVVDLSLALMALCT